MLCECLILLACTRMTLKVIPFKRLAKKLGSLMAETPHVSEARQKETLMRIESTFRRIKRYFPWHPSCLVQAMTAQKMLSRRDIASTIYLGVAKDPHCGLEAHAWLRSGTTYVTGAEAVDLKAFTIVSCFGDRPGNREGR